MAAKTGAGALHDKAGFEKRATASDGHGGWLNAFAEQFVVRVKMFHMRGGETILAGRLEGVSTVVFRARRSPDSVLVTTDWRIVDKATGLIYAIKSITPSDDRAYLDFLAETGGAA